MTADEGRVLATRGARVLVVRRWWMACIEGTGQDLRYAARTLRRSPVFLLTGVLLLSLGVGVDLALFQIVDAIVLQPLRVKEPATLVRLHRRSPVLDSSTLPYPAAEHLRQEVRDGGGALSAVLVRSRAEVTWQETSHSTSPRTREATPEETSPRPCLAPR